MTEISLEEAKAIVERLEKGNVEYKQLVERAERLKTLEVLGGKSEAGIPQTEVSPEEKLKQDAKNFFKGSNVEQALEKYG